MERVGTRLKGNPSGKVLSYSTHALAFLAQASVSLSLGGFSWPYWGPRKAADFTFLEAIFTQQETDCEQTPKFLTPWERNCNVCSSQLSRVLSRTEPQLPTLGT